jgi:hypothetical protein
MVSDIVLLEELPQAVQKSVSAYIGCVAGALLKERYLETIKSAGFSEVKVIGETSFGEQVLEAEPALKAIANSESIPESDMTKAGKAVRSIKVSAIKRRK